MTALAARQNFYVIVGSAARALVGLQFVVMSLIADRPSVRADASAGHAFATPAYAIADLVPARVRGLVVSCPASLSSIFDVRDIRICRSFSPTRGVLGVGAAALLMLYAGIHNAWDAVTYHVFVKSRESEKQS